MVRRKWRRTGDEAAEIFRADESTSRGGVYTGGDARSVFRGGGEFGGRLKLCVSMYVHEGGAVSGQETETPWRRIQASSSTT